MKVSDKALTRHKDDATSVTLMVSELIQEPFNPILIFKKQGMISDVYPDLGSDRFVLAIQTKFQRDLYCQFAHGSVLCIDSTHGTNVYHFKLITCIVVDHYGNGNFWNNIIIITNNQIFVQVNSLLGA